MRIEIDFCQIETIKDHPTITDGVYEGCIMCDEEYKTKYINFEGANLFSNSKNQRTRPNRSQNSLGEDEVEEGVAEAAAEEVAVVEAEVAEGEDVEVEEGVVKLITKINNLRSA